MKIVRNDLIEQVINDLDIIETGVRKDYTDKICRKLLSVIRDNLIKMNEGDKMELRGIGTFIMRKRKGYTAHNPKNMKKVECKECLVLSFKRGELIKSILKNKK